MPLIDLELPAGAAPPDVEEFGGELVPPAGSQAILRAAGAGS